MLKNRKNKNKRGWECKINFKYSGIDDLKQKKYIGFLVGYVFKVIYVYYVFGLIVKYKYV